MPRGVPKPSKRGGTPNARAIVPTAGTVSPANRGTSVCHLLLTEGTSPNGEHVPRTSTRTLVHTASQLDVLTGANAGRPIGGRVRDSSATDTRLTKVQARESCVGSVPIGAHRLAQV